MVREKSCGAPEVQRRIEKVADVTFAQAASDWARSA
jgi:hypothetical protein